MILFAEPKAAFDYIYSQKKLISSKDRRQKMDKLLLRYKQLFLEMPAAKKHHHNYEGGLAIHTAQVLYYTLNIFEQLREHLPGINQENVYVTAVLHDLSKSQIYKRTEKDDGYPFDYNEKFNYEHDVWSIREANVYGLDLNYDEMMGILQAHGGWSRIVEPVSKLATIIHCADMICSQIIKK